MNRNLVGSIYGRSSIKIASSTPVSSTNKTDHHDIPVTEILLKEALNTINQTNFLLFLEYNANNLSKHLHV
jgi:hypothetical protein